MASNTTLLVKRGRGRPRRDEPPQINNFDLNLIALYKQNPALYDRYDDDYGNRDLADRVWRDMAQELGVDVTMLRDRVQQLRNRFNVEKRKLDALRAETHNDSLQSPWGLYKEMVFLEKHVRWRRRGEANYSSDSEDQSHNGTANSTAPITNGGEAVATYQRNATIKHNESSQSQHASTPNANNSYYVINHSLRNGHVSSTIGTRSSLRMANAQANNMNNTNHNASNIQSHTTPMDTTEDARNNTANGGQLLNGLNAAANNQSVLDKNNNNPKALKFKYYSQFLNSCLCDMGEREAMNLIARWTGEICNVLKEDGSNKRESVKSDDESAA